MANIKLPDDVNITVQPDRHCLLSDYNPQLDRWVPFMRPLNRRTLVY